jgi:hypothetical protein
MEDALLFQLRNATDKYMHAAKLLEDSMAGMGTKDHLLVSRTIRYHWDRNTLNNVKGAYQQRYGQRPRRPGSEEPLSDGPLAHRASCSRLGPLEVVN